MAVSQSPDRSNKRAIVSSLVVVVAGLISAFWWNAATLGTGDTGQAWSPLLTLGATAFLCRVTYITAREKPQWTAVVAVLAALGLLLWPLGLDGPIGHAHQP